MVKRTIADRLLHGFDSLLCLHTMFLEESDYSFTRILKRNYRTIQQECFKIPESLYSTWPETYLYGSGWKVFGFCRLGKLFNFQSCPQTIKIIRQIPNLYSAGFSLLKSGTVIKPHKGKTKGIIRCHLGLKTPAGCALIVAGQSKQWREGSVLVFDDTSEHSAYNKSSQDRIVFLLDVLR